MTFLTVCLNPTLQKTLVFDTLGVGEVNRAREERLDASGKGVNVTRVLRQLGEDVVHLTHAGGRDRQLFEALCREDDLSLEIISCESPLRTCTTLLERATGSTTELIEPTRPVEADVEGRVFARYRELLPGVEVVVISGSTAPGYGDDLFARMIAEARRAGSLVIADFRGEPLKRALANEPDQRPQVIKPNLQEFAATFFSGEAARIGEHTGDAKTLDLARGVMQELAESGVRVVLTRGRNPALFLDNQGVFQEAPTIPLEPVNTIGCGDAFTAGFSVSFARDGDLAPAVEAGHAAAAMNAVLLKPGSIRESSRDR
ncbi:1-phosphofructokinase/tagatose 6-phosphate kinase [Alkalispirochaeta americana]|uniref:1-phosphofructokinase/tagatose 6-phosphate kinase n=1 Tax=Alkalispirochaeta americana TaxID=159291 RepID=A0A1N6UHX0_9SPIO|nr:PfkB family carbohydrate kinase [Alkalispirochaeta americana]SIQ65190.1 1-phosphofructokinase/tagatose 6-phosphate kinase [Alkalispirochaeta americana]